MHSRSGITSTVNELGERVLAGRRRASLGQRQTGQVMRALSLPTHMTLILDEWTAHLDADNIARVDAAIEGFVAAGGRVFETRHQG